VRQEVSVIIGYPFKSSSDATAEIGPTKFAMSPRTTALDQDVAEETRFVEAMRKGADLTSGHLGAGRSRPTSSPSKARPGRSTAPSRNCK